MSAFWEGMLAGYGIAIPVGAISILIFEKGLLEGFFSGFLAGSGAATADTIYAIIASLAGLAVAAMLAPYSAIINSISALVLLIIGGYGIWRAVNRHFRPISASPIGGQTGRNRTFWQFLALTMVNPLTVVYFTALILSRQTGYIRTPAEQVTFIAGAGLASLSWQSLLAGAGSMAVDLKSSTCSTLPSNFPPAMMPMVRPMRAFSRA